MYSLVWVRNFPRVKIYIPKNNPTKTQEAILYQIVDACPSSPFEVLASFFQWSNLVFQTGLHRRMDLLSSCISRLQPWIPLSFPFMLHSHFESRLHGFSFVLPRFSATAERLTSSAVCTNLPSLITHLRWLKHTLFSKPLPHHLLVKSFLSVFVLMFCKRTFSFPYQITDVDTASQLGFGIAHSPLLTLSAQGIIHK